MEQNIHTSPTASQGQGADGLLVGKAVVRAGEALGLRQGEVAEIIGLSASQVSKIKDGKAALTGKPFELALYLIRIFRSLDSITGGDPVSTRAWMRNRNTALRGVPADLVKQAAGLVGVMSYLDAQRAPL